MPFTRRTCLCCPLVQRARCGAGARTLAGAQPTLPQADRRRLALARLRDLPIVGATHPAMVRYLDNEQNPAKRLNEDCAREVMEWHTLGVDAGYTQHDVQKLAPVLTGLGHKFKEPVHAVGSALRVAHGGRPILCERRSETASIRR